MTIRTDYCGRLSVDDIGRVVTVCGWVSKRREHGEFLAFVDLRDPVSYTHLRAHETDS